MYLIFDTETTGLPQNWKAPLTDFDNWPRLVQLAWQVHDIEGKLIDVQNYIVKPEGFDIPYNAAKIHGISTDRAEKEGMPLVEVLEIFMQDLEKVKFVVGHNVSFDNNIVGCEFLRKNMFNLLQSMPAIDTKDDATDYCQIPSSRGAKFKWPKLIELHQKLFGESFAEAHNASADVEATARCFLELLRLDVISFSKVGMSTKENLFFVSPDGAVRINADTFTSALTAYLGYIIAKKSGHHIANHYFICPSHNELYRLRKHQGHGNR